jgi:pimeloyl-ACP methyl ester carboxylesterase
MQNERYGFIESGGVKITYKVIGDLRSDREIIVFLHGNGEDSTRFKKCEEYFRHKYDLILIDSRGHGNSEIGKEKLTINLMADDVAAVINKLKVKKVHVLGFSDGGNIALAFAVKYESRLKSAMLISANAVPSGLKAWFRYFIRFVYYISLPISFLEWVKRRRRLFALMVFEPDIKREQLEKISIPVLIMAGEYDIIKEAHTRAIARTIPDSTLKIIKSAGHMSFRYNPQQFIDNINEFLDKYHLSDN